MAHIFIDLLAIQLHDVGNLVEGRVAIQVMNLEGLDDDLVFGDLCLNAADVQGSTPSELLGKEVSIRVVFIANDAEGLVSMFNVDSNSLYSTVVLGEEERGLVVQGAFANVVSRRRSHRKSLLRGFVNIGAEDQERSCLRRSIGLWLVASERRRGDRESFLFKVTGVSGESASGQARGSLSHGGRLGERDNAHHVDEGTWGFLQSLDGGVVRKDE